jgi:hypothetical protein
VESFRKTLKPSAHTQKKVLIQIFKPSKNYSSCDTSPLNAEGLKQTPISNVWLANNIFKFLILKKQRNKYIINLTAKLFGMPPIKYEKTPRGKQTFLSAKYKKSLPGT